jgi:hypothetical protein
MSEADELRAGIQGAIAMEENAMAALVSMDATLDELLGQLMMLAVSSNNPRARSSIIMTQKAVTDLTQVSFDLLEVRSALDEWLTRP